MQVLLLWLVKSTINVVFFISKLFNSFEYDTLIVGNYDHITVDQQALLDILKTEGISYRFIFTPEKAKFILKFLAYLRLSWLLPKAPNIVIYDYCFPLYCIEKPKNQKHIQLWHGNGAFKKFGLPNFYEKYGIDLGKKLYKLVPIHSSYDYIFVSNEKCIPHYMEAFGIYDQDKFLVSNNIILNMITDAKEKNKKQYDPNNITVICAPTYNYETEYDMYGEFKNKLVELGQAKNVKVGFSELIHPKIEPTFDKIGTLLNADFLVTDYSSVCFEAEGAGLQVAFLRSNEQAEVFIENAKYVYNNVEELACDILENKVLDNELNNYLCPDPSIQQIDMTVELIKKNRM